MIPIRPFSAAVLLIVFQALSGCSSAGPMAPMPALSAEDVISPAILVPPDDPRPWPFDPWTHLSHDIQGDTLSLVVRYGGGCREHRFALLIDRAFLESLPVQVGAQLAHDADGDLCRALLTRTLRFDLTPLREHFQASYGPGGGTVVIRLGERGIIYTF